MTNEAARKNDSVHGANSLDDQWGAALSEQGAQEETAAVPSAQTAAPAQAAQPATAPEQPRVAAVKKIDARPASFNALTDENAGAVGNINMVLDIPITVS